MRILLLALAAYTIRRIIEENRTAATVPALPSRSPRPLRRSEKP